MKRLISLILISAVILGYNNSIFSYENTKNIDNCTSNFNVKGSTILSKNDPYYTEINNLVSSIINKYSNDKLIEINNKVFNLLKTKKTNSKNYKILYYVAYKLNSIINKSNINNEYKNNICNLSPQLKNEKIVNYSQEDKIKKSGITEEEIENLKEYYESKTGNFQINRYLVLSEEIKEGVPNITVRLLFGNYEDIDKLLEENEASSIIKGTPGVSYKRGEQIIYIRNSQTSKRLGLFKIKGELNVKAISLEEFKKFKNRSFLDKTFLAGIKSKNMDLSKAEELISFLIKRNKKALEEKQYPIRGMILGDRDENLKEKTGAKNMKYHPYEYEINKFELGISYYELENGLVFIRSLAIGTLYSPEDFDIHQKFRYITAPTPKKYLDKANKFKDKYPYIFHLEPRE